MAPEKIVSKDAMLLSQLWQKRDKNNSVPLRGENSFYSIAKQILNSSYSPSTALESLIELNAVRLFEIDENKVMVIVLQNYLDIAIKEKYELYINQVGKVIEKLSDTLMYNMESEDVNFQQTLFSSQIPITNQTELHAEMKTIANTTIVPLIYKCFEKYEKNVPKGTYPEIGFSMFEYRDNKINKR